MMMIHALHTYKRKQNVCFPPTNRIEADLNQHVEFVKNCVLFKTLNDIFCFKNINMN